MSRRSQIALLGVCCDRGSSFARGSAEAPDFIRQALACDSGNDYSEARRALGMKHWHDLGNLIAPEDETVDEVLTRALEQDLRPIILGGDHGITRATVPPFHRRNEGRPLCVVQFDAHPDIYPLDEAIPCVSGAPGDRFSHASQFTKLLEDGKIDALCQVGIRTCTESQWNYAAADGRVSMLTASSVGDCSGPAIAAQVDLCLSETLGSEAALAEAAIFVSMDLDGLDPSIAPGVAHVEPGGLTLRQCLGTIQTMCSSSRIVGADVVELLPSADPTGLTARVAAKIVKELACRILNDGPAPIAR